MGIAPAIGAAASAVGTIAGISAQRRQAAAQRQAIESNRLAAEQAYELSRQRFEYTRETSAAMFERERAILEFADEQARRQFDAQQQGQRIANAQSRAQQMQIQTGIDSQVAQLLGQASAVEGQASLNNVNRLAQGAGVVAEAGNRSEVFGQRQSAMGQGSQSQQVFRNLSLLDAAAQLQVLQEAAATDRRVAGFQSSALRNNADRAMQYGDLVSRFLASQQQATDLVNNAANAITPTLLDLQSQRNLAALNTANLARQAESALGEQSAAIQLLNANRTADAQQASVQSPNYLGAVASIGASLAPLAALYNNQQPSQQFQFSPRFTFDTSRTPTFTAPNASFATPNTVQFPTLLDVPLEVPVYG